jgi:hypothetical protein
MSFDLTYLGLGIALAAVVGIAAWAFSASSRSSEKRRADLEARRLSHQPWDADGAGGRANR